MDPDLHADVPVGATPAAYGKACSNCARAKCRCVYSQADGPDCIRCRRLKKQCVPSTSVRRRTGRRLLASRTEKLEEKLEDLFSLVQNQKLIQQNGAANPALNATLPSPPLAGPSAGTAEASVNRPIVPQTTAYYTPSNSNHSVTPKTSAPEDDPSNTFEAYRTEAEANNDFNDFRTHMLSFFPFIYLPVGTTSQQLREQYPFLWLNIMCITSRNSAAQVKMSRAIRTHVAMMIVVEQEANLDLLFGLLTFVSWCYYHKKDKGHLATMGGLVGAQLLDLGLTRGRSGPHLVTCIKQYHESEKDTSCRTPKKPLTMEERRALLGAYYALSQPSIKPKKLEGLRWSEKMDECVEVLAQTPEHPGDQLLATLVKLQLIAEDVNIAAWAAKKEKLSPFYLSAIQGRVQDIKRDMPGSVQNNAVVVCTMYYIEAVIHDKTMDWDGSSSSHKPDFLQCQSVETILVSIKGWFDFYFCTPLESRIGMTFTLWCQFAQLVFLLYRMTAASGSTLDRTAIRDIIDIIATCEEMTASFERLIQMRSLQSGENGEVDEHIFSKFCRIVRSLKERWMTEFSSPPRDELGNEPEDQFSGGFIDGIQSGPMAVPLYPTDQGWLTDIFNVSWS